MARILVVDDEKNYLVVLSVLLSGEGYKVDSAQSGAKALALAEKDEPDLVITDMRMPHMSGLELIHKLKVNAPDLPVIVMTAYGTVGKRGGGHEGRGRGLHRQAL